MKSKEYITHKLNELISIINKEYITEKYDNAEFNLLESKFGGRCLLLYVQGHDMQYVQFCDGSVITQDKDNETVPIFPYCIYDYRQSAKDLNVKLKESTYEK